MKYVFVIVFLIFSLGMKGQSAESTWHLSKSVEGNDTIKFNTDIKKGRIEELTFYSENASIISRDTITEDSVRLVLIGQQNSVGFFFDEEMNEEYEEGSCPCFIYQSIIKKDLFFQLCESQRAFFNIQLKNEELHLTILRYLDWRKEEYKKQNIRKFYIYIQGL